MPGIRHSISTRDFRGAGFSSRHDEAARALLALEYERAQNNDKKMKWLVEPIGIPVLHGVLLEEEEEAPKMRFRSIRL